VRNGNSDYTARQAARIYRALSMDNLYLAPGVRMVELQDGAEPIHMEDPKSIATHIDSMIRSIR